MTCELFCPTAYSLPSLPLFLHSYWSCRVLYIYSKESGFDSNCNGMALEGFKQGIYDLRIECADKREEAL